MFATEPWAHVETRTIVQGWRHGEPDSTPSRRNRPAALANSLEQPALQLKILVLHSLDEGSTGVSNLYGPGCR